MRTSHLRYFAVAALAAVALAACSSSSKPSASTTPGTNAATNAPTSTAVIKPATTAPGGPATGSATVSLGNSKFGKILVDSKGMSLYVDENDKPGKQACTGACLTAWPPVVAPDSPTYGAGLTASLYSSITLPDGTKQLTVKGSPLYTWAGDKKAGDVTGQDVNGFYVVQASGIKYDPGAAKAG
jgi:predicted lipoprotein with Yx(FWY)xxD motif